MARWVVRVELTEAQIRMLTTIAVGGALAGEGEVERRMWDAVVSASSETQEEIDKTRAASTARRAPCPLCGRIVGRRASGIRRVVRHKCSHGRVCESRGCRECEEERR